MRLVFGEVMRMGIVWNNKLNLRERREDSTRMVDIVLCASWRCNKGDKASIRREYIENVYLFPCHVHFSRIFVELSFRFSRLEQRFRFRSLFYLFRFPVEHVEISGLTEIVCWINRRSMLDGIDCIQWFFCDQLFRIWFTFSALIKAQCELLKTNSGFRDSLFDSRFQFHVRQQIILLQFKSLRQ